PAHVRRAGSRAGRCGLAAACGTRERRRGGNMKSVRTRLAFCASAIACGADGRHIASDAHSFRASSGSWSLAALAQVARITLLEVTATGVRAHGQPGAYAGAAGVPYVVTGCMSVRSANSP